MSRITVSAQGAQITPNGNRLVSVELDEPETDELLDAIGLKEAIRHFDTGDLLAEIGAENVVASMDEDELADRIGEEKIVAHFGMANLLAHFTDEDILAHVGEEAAKRVFNLKGEGDE